MRSDIRKAFEPTQTGVPPRFSTVASSCSNEAISCGTPGKSYVALVLRLRSIPGVPWRGIICLSRVDRQAQFSNNNLILAL
jgi:hypothetical protein